MPSVGNWLDVNVTNIVKDAIDNNSGIVDIFFELRDVVGIGTYATPQFYSKTGSSGDTSLRPKIVIEKTIETALAITATIPSTTATYVYEQTAAYTALAVSAVVPAITATFAAFAWTVAFTAISVVATIPSMVASWKGWEMKDKNSTTWTNKTKN